MGFLSSLLSKAADIEGTALEILEGAIVSLRTLRLAPADRAIAVATLREVLGVIGKKTEIGETTKTKALESMSRYLKHG